MSKRLREDIVDILINEKPGTYEVDTYTDPITSITFEWRGRPGEYTAKILLYLIETPFGVDTENLYVVYHGKDVYQIADKLVKCVEDSNVFYAKNIKKALTFVESHDTERQRVIDKIIKFTIREFHDPENIVTETGKTPYIYFNKEVKLGKKYNPVIMLRTQSLEPYENNERVQFELASSDRPTQSVSQFFSIGDSDIEFEGRLRTALDKIFHYKEDKLLAEGRYRG